MKRLPYILCASVLLCSLALSSAGFAFPNHFEIIGAPGVANLRGDNSELGVTASETDRLVQNNNNNNWNTFTAQLGAGYIYYFSDTQLDPVNVQWFPSMEPQLNIYYLNNNTGIKGDVWRFNNSAFNDFTFNMPIRSTRLMLDVALTVAAWRQLSIYAIGGIGEAWNRMSYSDNENGNVSCPEQRVSLNSKTNSNFAWEVGAGLSFAFNDRISLSLEYLYVNLGNVRAAASGNTGTITTPVLAAPNFNLHAQTGLLGLHVAL